MVEKEKIIVALDGVSEKEALRIAKILKGHAWGFKINDLLFSDIKIIQKLKKFGKVFADAKLYDIPNTVSNSIARLSGAGADIITVHASGGIEMMKSAKLVARRTKILAVTVLTSKKGNSKEVSRLTQDSIIAGVDGIVCSGLDLISIRNIRGAGLLLKIIPGIRPQWYKKKDDQKQTITPNEAIRQGADYIVIGRPILDAKDPLGALMDIFVDKR